MRAPFKKTFKNNSKSLQQGTSSKPNPNFKPISIKKLSASIDPLTGEMRTPKASQFRDKKQDTFNKVISFPNLYYNPHFLNRKEVSEVIDYIRTIYPIWEQRYSPNNPPPEGETQRTLLRPVYWLGNWQFACLNYYHPPKGIMHRCVAAESFPTVLQKMAHQIETIAREYFKPMDIPKNWHLNTCLINFYGDQIQNGKKIDTARVGEHRDYEPGPVGSISIGERAFFQFVESDKIGTRNRVVFQQWLDDGSLQIFGGRKLKDVLFHRVQRVERKTSLTIPINVENFQTRRLNFTFRYVPVEHVFEYNELPLEKQNDIRPYIEKLATKSDFFTKLLEP